VRPEKRALDRLVDKRTESRRTKLTGHKVTSLIGQIVTVQKVTLNIFFIWKNL